MYMYDNLYIYYGSCSAYAVELTKGLMFVDET